MILLKWSNLKRFNFCQFTACAWGSCLWRACWGTHWRGHKPVWLLCKWPY